MGQSLFTMLDAEWSNIVRRPETIRELGRWSIHAPILGRFGDLDELVRFAQEPGHPAASDEVLQCLARHSESDPLAARALLQAVMYALIPIAARFRSAVGGDGSEIAAVVIAGAYDRIRNYPIARRPRRIAANIVLDTQQTVSRSLCRPRVDETLMAEIDRLPVEAPPPPPLEQVVALIDEALSRGRICRYDASLIAATRLFDVPIEQLAVQFGCLPHSLRRRRLRAENALAAAVA